MTKEREEKMSSLSFSDARTAEIWLPSKVAKAISGDKGAVHLVIITTREKQTYYVNGLEAHVMNLGEVTPSSSEAS